MFLVDEASIEASRRTHETHFCNPPDPFVRFSWHTSTTAHITVKPTPGAVNGDPLRVPRSELIFPLSAPYLYLSFCHTQGPWKLTADVSRHSRGSLSLSTGHLLLALTGEGKADRSCCPSCVCHQRACCCFQTCQVAGSQAPSHTQPCTQCPYC